MLKGIPKGATSCEEAPHRVRYEHVQASMAAIKQVLRCALLARAASSGAGFALQQCRVPAPPPPPVLSLAPTLPQDSPDPRMS